MKKVLITGGAGFIGSNLTKLLVKKGIEVIVVDNLSTGYMKNIEGLNIRFIHDDIRNREKMEEVMLGVDTVFHLAASVGRQKSLDAPFEDSDVNLIGTLSILEAMRINKVKKIVYSSSAAIYGELLTDTIDESHELNADSPYGVSKLAAEKMIIAYGKIYNFTTICLRYFNIFGEGQRYDFYGNVIPIFVKRALNNEDIIIYGDGTQTRDFINVKDVANVNYLSSLNSDHSFISNVGVGEAITIISLAHKIIEYTNSTSNIVFSEKREADVLHCKANIKTLIANVNYVPKKDFDRQLEEYIDWFKNEKH